MKNILLSFFTIPIVMAACCTWPRRSPLAWPTSSRSTWCTAIWRRVTALWGRGGASKSAISGWAGACIRTTITACRERPWCPYAGWRASLFSWWVRDSRLDLLFVIIACLRDYDKGLWGQCHWMGISKMFWIISMRHKWFWPRITPDNVNNVNFTFCSHYISL